MVEVIRQVGMTLIITMTRRDEERLSKTCFRGQGVRKAGNFIYWRKFQDLFRNNPLKKQFLKEIGRTIQGIGRGRKESFSFTVGMPYPIGWSSTIGLARVNGCPVEKRVLNRRSEALFVNSEEILAPLTNDVTFICEIRRHLQDPNTWELRVWSVYPGPDVGELYGNLTERENVVFFSWEHPGGAF